jgi:hypothetical protein
VEYFSHKHLIAQLIISLVETNSDYFAVPGFFQFLSLFFCETNVRYIRSDTKNVISEIIIGAIDQERHQPRHAIHFSQSPLVK